MYQILKRIYNLLLSIVSRIIIVQEPLPINYDATRQQMQKIREEHARNQDYDYSHVFRKKTDWDLIRVSFIVVGIEFAYAAETSFVAPTLLEIGIEHKHMTLVWSLSPFLALVFSPILGSISDKCRLHYGRRRPIILTFSVTIIVGLLLFCFGKSIGFMLGDEDMENLSRIRTLLTSDHEDISESMNYLVNYKNHYYKYAAIVTICGTILLDFSADIIIISARTYLLDVCRVGGFLGFSVTGINWEITEIGEILGGNIRTVFTIVTSLIVLSCIITLTSFREIPLSLLERNELLRPLTQAAVKQEIDRKKKIIFIVKKENDHEHPYDTEDIEMQVLLPENESDDKTTIAQFLRSIVIMPRIMQMLCLTNLLSWSAFVSYCLYFTDFVGETVFMGDPMAPPNTESLTMYQTGVRFGCYGLAVYALSCSVYSLVIENLIKLFGLKMIYVGGLTIFGISMFLLATFPTQLGVLILSIPAGIIYSTMLTIPFLLMAKYHACSMFVSVSESNNGSTNCRGLGTDMAVLSGTACISQVIISLIAGFVIDWIGSSNAVIYLAGVLGLISAFSASKVLYIDTDL